MRKMNRRSFLVLAGATGVAGCAGVPRVTLLTEAASERRATLIVPAPPGSRTGAAGRILAASLARELARPVDIANVEGAGAAYEILASAPPDGSTIGLVAADLTAAHWAGLTAAGPQSVTPLALLNEDPAGIHVREGAPWSGASELLESIRRSPGRLTASGAGRNAIWHVSASRWTRANGLGAAALPWDAAPGPAAAARMLVDGGPAVVVCSVPEIRASPVAKKIRTLAVMAKARSRRYPAIAAVSEGGLPFRAGLWRGVAGPQRMAPEAAATMRAALWRVYASEAFRRDMFRRGFDLAWADAPQFARFMEAENRAMGSVLRAAA